MIDNFIDWFMEGFVRLFFLGFIAALVFGIPLLVYGCHQESLKPAFELKKDDWSCSREHQYTSTTFVVINKVMVPQTYTRHECTQWSHK